MSIKTPEEIAAEQEQAWLDNIFDYRTLRDVMVGAIKADREQIIEAVRKNELYDDDVEPFVYCAPLIKELEVGL